MTILDQRRRIPAAPGCAARAEIPAEGLLAPGAVHGRADRREGRDAAIAPRVAQRADQRAVAAHRVTEDPGARLIDGELLGHQRRQLARNVGVHAVVHRPRRRAGVHIEAGARTEVIAVVFAGQVGAARRGIGHHQGQAELRCAALRAGLDREVLLRAGQSGEEVQHGYRPGLGRRRHEHGKAHGRAGLDRVVTVAALHAVEAALLADGLERHLSTLPPSGSTRRRASGRSRR